MREVEIMVQNIADFEDSAFARLDDFLGDRNLDSPLIPPRSMIHVAKVIVMMAVELEAPALHEVSNQLWQVVEIVAVLQERNGSPSG
jgi:hypothetical protein